MIAFDTMRRKIKGKMFKLVPGLITCREVESFVLAYLEDDLPAPQKKVFEWHLRMCRECRDYLAAYKASIELAKHAVEREDSKPDLPVPEDLITAIIEARTI